MFAIHDYELRSCSSYHEAAELYTRQAKFYKVKPAPENRGLAVPLRDDGQHRKKYYLVKDDRKDGTHYQFWFEDSCVVEWHPHGKMTFDNCGHHTRSTQQFANRFLPTRKLRVVNDACSLEIETQFLTKSVINNYFVYHKGDVITLKKARERDPNFRSPYGYQFFQMEDGSCTVSFSSLGIGLKKDEFVRRSRNYTTKDKRKLARARKILNGMQEFFDYAKFMQSMDGACNALPRRWITDKQFLAVALDPPSSEYWPDILGAVLRDRTDVKSFFRSLVYEHCDCYVEKFIGFGRMP